MPQNLPFGPIAAGQERRLPVEIRSTGATALTLAGVQLSEDTHPDFSLDLGDHQLPATLEPGAQVTVEVVYSPTGDEPTTPRAGTLVISWDAAPETVTVGLSALTLNIETPTAVGHIAGPPQVEPQTVLHLSGEASHALGAEIAEYQWSVVQPEGSMSQFVPSSSYPNPTFEANVAGTYEFSLSVVDTLGNASAAPWTYQIIVVPSDAIHIELLWETPGDPDETDEGPEAGSDLDLHFAELSLADSDYDADGDGVNDPWFDTPFDVFWFNAHPNWGEFDPLVDDDPHLDRDDTDGGGPENLNLMLPEDTTYAVGVHFWDDHGWGEALATVRVYVYGQLVYQTAAEPMVDGDFWYVGDLDWATQTVTPVDTLTPTYTYPYFMN